MNFSELQARIDLADVEGGNGNFETALTLITDVLSELENPHLPPYPERDNRLLNVQFNAYFSHLVLVANRGDFNEALRIAEHTLAFSEKYSPQSISSSWNMLGVTHWQLGNYNKSLEYYSKILAEDEMVGRNSRARAGTLVNCGLVYSSLGSFDKALEHYEQALTLLTNMGEKPFRANVLYGISDVYSTMGLPENASQYLAMSLALYEELGDTSGISNVMLSTARAYNQLGSHHLALESFGKALATYEELGYKLHTASALGGIGETNRLMGSYSIALENFGRALALHVEIGGKQGMGAELANLGIVYATKEFEGYDPAKGEDYLRRGLAISNDLGNKKMSYEIHMHLAALYEREGRWQEALEHYQKYITIRDEVQSEEAKKQSNLMEQRRQTAEREKEIEIARATAAAKLSATTNLLHKVLPESISTRMIAGEENIADYFPSVSILFADIVGFTPISSKMPAPIVVRFLNHIFREFDRIIKFHGCEKIKTMGDGYMAVSGAPIECDDHAERIAAAALEMQQAIELPNEIREYLPEGTKFGVRIGLHTGSVVAGVIGEDRFVWDIYSDAVNTAARMESHGEPDRIHVSEEFVRELKVKSEQLKVKSEQLKIGKEEQLLITINSSLITAFPRGEMEIKGKGMMKTYFLEKK